MLRKRFKNFLAMAMAGIMLLGSVPVSAASVQNDVMPIEDSVVEEFAVSFDANYAEVGKALSAVVTGASDVTYKWYVDGMLVSNESSYTPTESDLESWIEVVVNDGTKSISQKIYCSKLPVVYIDTEGGQPITSKENYIDATIKIQGNAQYSSSEVLYEGATEIRGRGNSTWGQPKKPYRLKLDKKADVFGMGKSKHWVLLANYLDESLMRNTLAYDLSGEMGMEHLSTVWVDVIMNGEYVGNYQFCENVRVDDGRVEILDWEGYCEDAAAVIAEAESLSDDEAGDLETYMAETSMSWISSGKVSFNGKTYNLLDYNDALLGKLPKEYRTKLESIADLKNLITGGYILELDSYYDEFSKFKTNSGQPMMFKNPEFVATNNDMLSYVQDYVQAFEDAVNSSDYTTNYNGESTHYSDLYDLDALVDYWLVTEIFFNEEMNKKSTYMYKDVDELMIMGPIWDMDWSSGAAGTSAGSTTEWATLRFSVRGTHDAQDEQWYKYLVQDPYFLMKLQERYWEIRSLQVQNMLDRIDVEYEYLKESGAADTERWENTSTNRIYTFGQDVTLLKQWLNRHVEWMEEQMATEDSFDASFVKKNNSLSLTLTDQDGNALDADVEGYAPADAVAYITDDLKLSVSGNGLSGTAKIFINSKSVAEAIDFDGTEITYNIPASAFTEDVEKKNVIEVKIMDASGNVTASNYITVKQSTCDHSYGDWITDEEHHWKECLEECGKKVQLGKHTFEWKVDVEATEDVNGIRHEECTVCGLKRNENTEYEYVEEPADPSDSSKDIPVSNMVAISGNEHSQSGTEGPDDNVLDGNPNTIWHTQYGIDPTGGSILENRWIGVSFKEPTSVNGIRYLPRQGENANGKITEYEVQYRETDDGEWITVAKGTWNRTDIDWKYVGFSKVTAKQVRLVGVHTYAGSGMDRHMTCAEFRVVGPKAAIPSDNKDLLNAAIERAEKLNSEEYVDFAAVTAALNEAKTVAADTKATQEEVDAAMDALNAAINSLKKVNPSDVIPVSEMSATAGDYQPGDDPKNAIDENESTIWHTDWTVGPNHDNHWLQLELKDVYKVDGFHYLPRNGSKNGVITAYEIYASLDGAEWTKVADGTWTQDVEWKYVSFATIEAKYVKLVTIEAASDQGIKFASAAEVRLTGVRADGTVIPPANKITVSINNAYAKAGEALTVTVEGAEEVSYSWKVDGKQVSTDAAYTPAETDIESWIEVTVSDGTTTATTKMYYSKLPVVYIDTEGGQPIVSKEDYIDATIKLQGNDQYSDSKVLYEGATEIRGRGNSTWGQPKKPYRLKLDKKTDAFGMGKSKHWVLLANYMDESLMRNTLAYNLSGSMGMEQMSTVWVDVILNGKYVGNYQFCENIRADDTRVGIFDWEGFSEDAAAVIAEEAGMDDDTAGDLEGYMAEESMQWITDGSFTFKGNTYKLSDYESGLLTLLEEEYGHSLGSISELSDLITGGYILELDEYYDEVSTFRTDSNQPMMFKNPEFVKTNSDMMEYVQTYVQAFEDAVQSELYTAKYDGEDVHYSELYDFDALVDYWLISEIFFNEEFNKKSTYMYKEVDELMKMGPIWDMDWSSGGEGDTKHTNKWATLHFSLNAQANQWYKDLVQDPYFLMKVQERYWEIRDVQVQDMLDVMDDHYELLKESGAADGTAWGKGDQSFKNDYTKLKAWLNTHVAWMDTQMKTEDSFDASFLKKDAAFELSLTMADGTALEADTTGKVPADVLVEYGSEVTLNLSNADENAYVFINGKLYTTLKDAMETSIPTEKLASDGKNVIEVKEINDDGTVVAANYITVRVYGAPEVVDKTLLEEYVEEAYTVKKELYTEESVDIFLEALDNAERILADEAATQNEIDAAADALADAINALKTKEEPPVEDGEVTRLFGQGRYDTAYAVADALKEALGVDKFEAVVVATGKNFADALAGSYLAVKKNAPILLTNGKEANVAQLHAYIKANVAEGGKVYILGGEGAVPASVDAIDGYEVERLYGNSRYDTNLEILKETGVSGDSVIVATGKTFADSLSASAAKLPILLVKPNAALNDAQKEILTGMRNIYIVGGEGAVSTDYEAELEEFGTVTRVFGDSRYDTSVEVAKTFCKDVDKAVVASGKNFPDGLCGGPLAAAMNAPLLLTKDGGASAATAYVAENDIASGFVLGGDGALADITVVEVFALESADQIITN